MAGTLVIDTLKSSTTGPAVFQNTSGTEVGQLCRAWVNFNGSTAAIRASFNVSSVVRNGTGDYSINFTNSLPDINYSLVGSTQGIAGLFSINSTGGLTTSSARLTVTNSTSAAVTDVAQICTAIFR